MANEQNLKPGAHKLTVDEQSKGGKKSAIVRGFRKTVDRFVKEHPEMIEEIVENLVSKALEGDLKATELLIELAGESPKQMDLKIKRDELKFRKEKDW